jgi:F-type H+-transporting ATPase subunit epsilon
MLYQTMHLKILLPFQVFADIEGVKRIVAETRDGSFGILPNRLDGVAALTPGILAYETQQEGEVFLAVDEGIITKTGEEVLVSVRNAIRGADLGELHKAVAEVLLNAGEEEKELRSTLARLEVDFVRRFAALKQV